MKTLQEIKEEIAEYHYGGMYRWDDLFEDIKLRMMDRVADRYASTLNRKVLEENEKMKEVLNRCDKTFGHLNKIFIALEEADQNELPELIKQIDLDLPGIQVQIKSLLSESSQGTKEL
jgi:radical SAM superfamily enzyme YgiQ (UPF0313 family)